MIKIINKIPAITVGIKMTLQFSVKYIAPSKLQFITMTANKRTLILNKIFKFHYILSIRYLLHIYNRHLESKGTLKTPFRATLVVYLYEM